MLLNQVLNKGPTISKHSVEYYQAPKKHYTKQVEEEVGNSSREVFGHIESVKILVILKRTGYMLTSSGFGLFIWGMVYRFL